MARLAKVKSHRWTFGRASRRPLRGVESDEADALGSEPDCVAVGDEELTYKGGYHFTNSALLGRRAR